MILIDQYEFWLEDGRQEYRMDCVLCGFGEDSISIQPFDIRHMCILNYLFKGRVIPDIRPFYIWYPAGYPKNERKKKSIFVILPDIRYPAK